MRIQYSPTILVMWGEKYFSKVSSFLCFSFNSVNSPLPTEFPSSLLFRAQNCSTWLNFLKKNRKLSAKIDKINFPTDWICSTFRFKFAAFNQTAVYKGWRKYPNSPTVIEKLRPLCAKTFKFECIGSTYPSNRRIKARNKLCLSHLKNLLAVVSFQILLCRIFSII